MGGHDDGGTTHQRVFEQLVQHCHRPVIERSKWFIQHQQFRFMQKRPGNRQTLSHAARKLARQTIFHTRQAYPFQCRKCCFAGVFHAEQLPEENQILHCREVVIHADSVAQVSDAPAGFGGMG